MPDPPYDYVPYGHIDLVIINPPNGTTPHYQWLFYNLEGNAIAGSQGTAIGHIVVIENIPIVGGGIFTFINASDDGVYEVQLVVTPAPPPY